MSLRYVFFRDDPSTHKEVYLARTDVGFTAVGRAVETNLTFDLASEAYEFAKPYAVLQSWRVGSR